MASRQFFSSGSGSWLKDSLDLDGAALLSASVIGIGSANSKRRYRKNWYQRRTGKKAAPRCRPDNNHDDVAIAAGLWSAPSTVDSGDSILDEFARRRQCSNHWPLASGRFLKPDNLSDAVSIGFGSGIPPELGPVWYRETLIRCSYSWSLFGSQTFSEALTSHFELQPNRFRESFQ